MSKFERISISTVLIRILIKNNEGYITVRCLLMSFLLSLSSLCTHIRWSIKEVSVVYLIPIPIQINQIKREDISLVEFRVQLVLSFVCNFDVFDLNLDYFGFDLYLLLLVFDGFSTWMDCNGWINRPWIKIKKSLWLQWLMVVIFVFRVKRQETRETIEGGTT